MSAGPAPPNPGQPRMSGPRPPTLSRLGPRILLGGLAVGLVYGLWPAASPPAPGTPSSGFKPPGVRNVENAYANGGGTTTHAKAYGGTVQGQKGAAGLREDGATNKRKGFEHDGIGDEQRSTQPTKVGEALNEMKYGSSRGK